MISGRNFWSLKTTFLIKDNRSTTDGYFFMLTDKEETTLLVSCFTLIGTNCFTPSIFKHVQERSECNGQNCHCISEIVVSGKRLWLRYIFKILLRKNWNILVKTIIWQHPRVSWISSVTKKSIPQFRTGAAVTEL